MALRTAEINWILLNRGADLFFAGENVFVPFGTCAAKDLAERLDRSGASEIIVEYHTVADAKLRARDEAKFSKRLDSLGGHWSRSTWTNKTVKGFVFPDTLVCTLTRIDAEVVA